MEQTFWNGIPCKARRVIVIVADDKPPLYWARPFVGQERAAVEITVNDYVFYIDDEGHAPSPEADEIHRRYGLPPDQPTTAGCGWAKVTGGMGSPQYGHATLKIERVVREVEPAALLPIDTGNTVQGSKATLIIGDAWQMFHNFSIHESQERIRGSYMRPEPEPPTIEVSGEIGGSKPGLNRKKRRKGYTR
jgi:hypothetical protein